MSGRLIIRTAPPGIEVMWTLNEGDLTVELADDLDEVTRKRYITEAQEATGWRPRRRALIPLIPLPEGKPVRSAVLQHPAGAAATAGMMLAGLVTAVAVGAAGDSGHHAPQPPPAAAPPSIRPHPAPPQHQPTPQKRSPGNRPSAARPAPIVALPAIRIAPVSLRWTTAPLNRTLRRPPLPIPGLAHARHQRARIRVAVTVSRVVDVRVGISRTGR